MRKICACLMILLLCAAAAHAESIVGAEPTCRVWLNGVEVSVTETAVCHRRIWTSRPLLSTTPVVIAPVEGPVEVTVEFLDVTVSEALVRPLSSGITPFIADGKVSFTLPAPGQITLEYNGQVQGALHLFLHAPADEPDLEAPEVLYYGPGVHEERQLILSDGDVLYLAEGCVLYGSVYAENADNITVAGPGVISGAIYDRFADQLVPIDFRNCSNVVIRDVTVLDPAAWTVNLYHCEDVLVENINIIGARCNSDGVSVQSCQRVDVKGCFIRSWDDALVVKGYDGNAADITFSDCIIWSDLAQSCEIGYETRADVIERITFRDITILHNFHKPTLAIHNSDNAAVRDILYENIVIEDGQMGEGDGAPFLIDLTTTKSQWSQSETRGTIRNVTFRNIELLSGKEPSIRIFSFNKTCNIDDVTIEGLRILGEDITSFDQLKYNKSPRNGKNIIILEATE